MAALPDVAPGQKITAQHINAIKNSVGSWVSDVDANGFTLKNAKFDAASRAAAQTPWAQDIDGAGFSLRNAGSVLAANVASQLVGYNIYYDTAWRKQQDGPGLAIIKIVGGGGSAFYASPTVTGATAPDPTPAMLFRDDGVIDIPRTLRVSAQFLYANTIVQTGDHSWNLDASSGTWRYVVNGYGNVLTSARAGGEFRLWSAPSGAAGSVASPVSVMTVWPNGLLNAASAQFTGDGTSAMSGPGLEAFYLPDNGGEGRIQAYDRPAGGFRRLLLTGTLVLLRDRNGTEVLRTDIGQVTVAASSRLALGNNSGERLVFYDGGGGTGGAQNTSMGIEGNALWSKCHTAGNFRWYIGNAPDEGASARLALSGTELLGDLVIAVKGQNGFSWNAKWAGNWYYCGPGNAPASMMYCDTATGGLRWLIGPTGAQGQIVPFVTALEMWNGGVALKLPLLLNNCPTSPSGQISGVVWRDAAAGNVLKIVP